MAELNNNKTILIVDDEPINIKLLAQIFKDIYQIKVAKDGFIAIQIVKKEKVDLILLDIEMPQMSGYDVCKELKNDLTTKSIPIIFVTAKTDDYNEEMGFRVGGVDYIKKPFQPTTVLARVNTHLKLYEQEEKLKEYNKKLAEQVEIEVLNRMKIEEEKKAQDIILIQQAKLSEMGEMISAIAHQWKQPLNSLSLIIQNAKMKFKRGLLNEEEIDILSNKVKNQIDFMLNTIDGFKNFLSPNKNNEIFNLKLSIEAIFNILKYQLDKDSISVEITEESRVIVYGVENELKQVFLNLFKNSKDAFSKDNMNRKISIKIFSKDNSGYIIFCDNASGIDEKLLPNKLFESYITTKGNEGTGIGLQISKKIIENNFKGTIEAYNSSGGACFKLSIPLATKID